MPIRRMLSNRAIREAAEYFRAKHWPSGGIPVDIELILERMGVNIIPQANLRRGVGIDACISADLLDLYIDLDYYRDERMAFRIRFSEAHELGHLVLHKDIFEKHQQNPPRTVLEWAQLIQNRVETEILEREADEFASCLLVPEPELRSLYEEHMPLIRDRFKQTGLDLSSVDPDTLRGYLANPSTASFMFVRIPSKSVCESTVFALTSEGPPNPPLQSGRAKWIVHQNLKPPASQGSTILPAARPIETTVRSES